MTKEGMEISDFQIPLVYYINLGYRSDRRERMERLPFDFGIEAVRFPAIRAEYVVNTRGFRGPGRYALSLAQRLIVRRARRCKVEAVLIGG